MNQPTTYEQLIAAKLQELSAPTKIDAIWARIEQQLDVEMPTDESGSTDTGASSHPGFFFPGSKFLYVFLAAVAGIYLLTRPSTTQNESLETKGQQTFQFSDSLNSLKDPVKNTDSEIIFSDKADISVNEQTISNDSTPIVVSDPEPAAIVTKEPESVVKSPITTANNETKKLPEPIINDTTVKKRRGVPGINLSDYKITPVKKDNQP